MFDDIFVRKKFVPERLEKYGFRKSNGNYIYGTDVFAGEFRLEITVGKSAVPDTKLTDNATGEEYILYKTGAVGAYVGEVREAVAAVLRDVADRCCDAAVFKEAQTLGIIGYACEKYGDEPEFLWDNSPRTAVFRRKDSGKWYGVLMTVPRRKLGILSDEVAEVLNLHGRPEIISELIDGKRVYPGWHMNKKHWYTVILDGTVSIGEIRRMIDESYMLAK